MHALTSISNTTRSNIVKNQEWCRTKSSVKKDVDYKCVSYGSQQTSNNNLQRSISADNVVIRSRGFKPSDRHDPVKRSFLENLTSKILHFEMDSGEAKPTPINLQKLLTPAMDTTELLQTRNKKMYASSCFYAPSHPTVEDQVELARRISYSLSDVKNMKSKGQSMYVNRKKRSVKWIHDGNGDEGEEEPPSPIHKDKIPLKCMMNPNGKVLDIQGIQALGEEPNVGTSPVNAEKLFDIVRDLNNQKGRGAEIFAKRRKRSEKWVVDKEQYQTPTPPCNMTKSPNFPTKFENGTNENSKFTSLPPLTTNLPTPTQNFESKPFYNPFTLDLSLDSPTPSKTGNDQRRNSQLSDSSSSRCTEIKKIYLREVAVGTDPEYGYCNESERSGSVEKSRRVKSFDVGWENRGNRRKLGNGYQKEEIFQEPKKEEIYRENGHSRRISHPHPHHHHHHHHHHHRQYQHTHQQSNGHREITEDEYTPVPVKQLIQEFEKTCRPTLQYKQISPKVIPSVQQVDNDLSKFFEAQSPRSSATKNPPKICNGNSQYARPMNGNGNAKSVVYNGNGYEKHFSRNCQENLIGRTIRYEEYESSEEEEIDEDSYDDSESEMNYRRCNVYAENSGNFANTGNFNNNGNFTNSENFSNGNCENSENLPDEYEMYVRQFDESTELYEAPAPFRHSEMNNRQEKEKIDDAKSMVLAMVASQEDILDTIKHLRNTPVLENLIGAPSPADFYADVGNNNKLSTETTYQGPKISSYQTLANYNTAPRGWDQAQTFYRPVTFGKQQEPIAYSDF